MMGKTLYNSQYDPPGAAVAACAGWCCTDVAAARPPVPAADVSHAL